MADAFLKQYGGSGADSSNCTAKKSQVLAGVTAITSDSNDEAEAGTMPERGAMNRTLAAGQSVTLPEGHYTGGTVSAQSLASQTGGATAEDRYVKKGLTYWKDGVLHTGTMETQSAISFSAAALSSTAIRISWKNPAKGPWEGIRVRMSTSGTPGASGGTEKYRGAGNNPNQGGGNNYVDITGLDPSQTYYFTCTSYYTGLPDGSSTNIQATTSDKTVTEIFAPYSSMKYIVRDSNESTNRSIISITPSGENEFLTGTDRVSTTITFPGYNAVIFIYQYGANISHNPLSASDLAILKKYSFKMATLVDYGQITDATLVEYTGDSSSYKYYGVKLICKNSMSGMGGYNLNNRTLTFYK